MRSWHRNLRDIGSSLGATRNEGLGPNSICSAPNLRRAPTRPEAPTTLEARKRFSDQRRPPDQKAIVGRIHEGRWFVERGKTSSAILKIALASFHVLPILPLLSIV